MQAISKQTKNPPASMESPLSTATWRTVPRQGALQDVSIFIALITTSACPASTCAPVTYMLYHIGCLMTSLYNHIHRASQDLQFECSKPKEGEHTLEGIKIKAKLTTSTIGLANMTIYPLPVMKGSHKSFCQAFIMLAAPGLILTSMISPAIGAETEPMTVGSPRSRTARLPGALSAASFSATSTTRGTPLVSKNTSLNRMRLKYTGCRQGDLKSCETFWPMPHQSARIPLQKAGSIRMQENATSLSGVLCPWLEGEQSRNCRSHVKR